MKALADLGAIARDQTGAIIVQIHKALLLPGSHFVLTGVMLTVEAAAELPGLLGSFIWSASSCSGFKTVA